jgi:hypothetical protein
VTNGVEIFLRWLKTQNPRDERVRALLTLALLVVDDAHCKDLVSASRDHRLDEKLIDELFAGAEAREVADLLQNHFGTHLSPKLFQRLYARALAASPDQDTRAALLFVAAHFLRLNPKSFQLSKELVDELKVSDDVDHRLAAITAIRHTAAPVSEVLTVILTALKQPVFDDKHSGLNQLAAILETDDLDFTSAPAVIDAIKVVLRQFSDFDPDANVRRASEHMLALLRQRGLGSP